MNEILDNIPWFALTGPHAIFAVGEKDVRRYARGFSPIIGLADPDNPDFDTLAGYCDPGEQIYCPQWRGEPPEGWQIHFETTLLRMIWDGPTPENDAFPDAVPLGPEHAEQALELAILTNPGPFGPRTIELGDYFGWFEDGQLAAMAGERLHAGTLREVSGIATHPDFRGRGLAHRLTSKMIHRELLRGETPFLHVMGENQAAVQLYLKMGFRVYCEAWLRVISRNENAGS